MIALDMQEFFRLDLDVWLKQNLNSKTHRIDLIPWNVLFSFVVWNFGFIGTILLSRELGLTRIYGLPLLMLLLNFVLVNQARRLPGKLGEFVG